MAVTEAQVIEVLRRINEPETQRDIVALRLVRKVSICEGNISVELATASPQKERLRQEVTAALSHMPGVEEVFVHFAAVAENPTAPGGTGGSVTAPAAPTTAGPGRGGPAHAAGPTPPRGLPGIRHIIAVGAGKGGVGKSTIAVNLALGLALTGKKVALLDGDIYGPSIPTLTGLTGAGLRPEIAGDRILPFVISGSASGAAPEQTAAGDSVSLAVMSIGFMVDKEKALIWRGPMAHGAMKQMLEQVEWTRHTGGELDYLIVDLPPGTGDVALTLAQSVPLTGAIIVATPQEVALADARRAVRMFQQLGVEILGVVENMSYFVCAHGTSYDIFGRGGARTMAQQMGLPFLGEVPIDEALRRHCDAGTPWANFEVGPPPAASREPLLAVTDALEKQLAVRLAMRPEAKPLRLQIT